MVDSMVNMTSRALRSDADDGRDRERDHRELCGVAQIESGDNETTTAHREVARAQVGRREQRADRSPQLVDSLLTSAEIGRLGGSRAERWTSGARRRMKWASQEARTSVRPLTGQQACWHGIHSRRFAVAHRLELDSVSLLFLLHQSMNE